MWLSEGEWLTPGDERRPVSTASERRARQALLMAADGLQKKEMAHSLSLPVQVVTGWRKRFSRLGASAPKDAHEPAV